MTFLCFIHIGNILMFSILKYIFYILKNGTSYDYFLY